MIVGSRVTLRHQVHTLMTSKSSRNIGLLIHNTSSQTVKLLLQLSSYLGLDVLLHLLRSICFRLLPRLAFLLKIAFERRNSHQRSLELVL